MMSQQVAERLVTIQLPSGLHLRPADAFVSLAKQFAAEVELSKDAEAVDGKSILSIITLAAGAGDQLLIRADGDDAEQAVSALAGLVERNFDVDLSSENAAEEPPSSKNSVAGSEPTDGSAATG